MANADGALSILNHPPQRLPGSGLLHDLVQHESDPRLPAIHAKLGTGEESIVPYRSLHRAAEHLASRIMDAVGNRSDPGTFVVPLLIPQCPRLYIAILAVLKAGGAFCPLHLDAPPERIQFIVDDVGATVLLATPGLVDKLPSGGDNVTVLPLPDAMDFADSSYFDVQDTFIAPVISPDQLAYVMYTSGSTGTPKGVGISHDAATQSIRAHDRHIPTFQRFLQFASPTFDVSVFEIIFPLFRGCTLVTCDRRRMLDDLPHVMNSMRVDACELTPTVAASLLRKRTSVPCLKLLLTIGEMLSEGVVQEFGGSPTVPSMLWGMYGPTEAAIHCTLQCDFNKSSSPRSIGIPLDTVSCFVVQIPEGNDGLEFRILPVGEVGELAIGGHQLATEYLNRPQQTAESFIETTYGRLYRTGDKAKANADGTLECFGRVADGQVKLRGQRIELGEVEQAAMRGSKCRTVVASVVDNTLVAFCVPEEATSNSNAVQDVFDACRAWLPSFMVPGDVLAMTQFPRLPSGKVDRKQLSQVFAKSKHDHNHHSDTSASNTLEAKVAALASTLLGSPVATTSALSACGLDSLKAIELASTLRTNGIESSALQILGSRTVSSLCDAIRNTKPAESTGDPSSILEKELVLSLDSPRQPEIESVYRCTPLQASMLVETSLHPSAYFNTVELEFPTQCQPDQIKSWFHRLAQDNDILRSYFIPHTRGFLRVVLRHLPDHHVLISEPGDDLKEPIEGSEVPSLKVQIYSGDGRRSPRALLRVHHAAYDGWTVDLMTQDLSTLVDGGSPSTRPQFDKVSSFHSGLLPQELDDSRVWWADHLRNWRPTSFPRLLSKISTDSQSRRATRKFGMNQRQLEQASTALGCHPQAFFQATVSLLWSMLLGTPDVVIGSVSSGRTIPVDGIEGIMGPCIFPAPLRINLDTSQSVAELLSSIQATNRDILKHGMLPLSEIKKVSEIQPGDPLYDVLLVYQQSLYSNNKATSPVREIGHFDLLETKVLLEIEPIDASEMWCHVTHHANAMSSSQAEILLEQLDHLAYHLISHVEAPVSDVYHSLPLSLSSMYNIEPPTSAGCCDLATAFERTALSRPEAPAISFADSISAGLRLQTVSYSELNEISNRIAWYLRSLCLGNGQVAVVVMDKSVMLYATILAALKAGCAYLPLLSSTPLERIDIAMRQAEAAVCLTDDGLLPWLQGGGVPCLVASVHSIDMSKFPAHNLSRQEEGSRPAYVICTSGTTGTPKSIVITHLNITSNLDVLSKIYPFDVDSRFLQLCSQSFDVSVFEIFFTWKMGACLCSGSHDTVFEDLEHSIRSMRCTHLSMTPTVAALVNPENVPNVRFLVTAGEPMTANVARKWGSLLYQGKNHRYGPAETTNICSVKKMSEKDDISHLGFSLPNTSTFVLSPKSIDLVPLNCLGELCFGGDQVAQGYLGLPEANASNFIHHPRFGRLYRSGDLGRMLPDGSMIITDRLDGQVKIRGQRLEIREVDSTLGNATNVHSSACLICRRDSASADRLVSFYVPRGTNEDDFRLLPIDQSQSSFNTKLFDLLQSRLPSYMLPTFLIPISTMPLTANGKVDKTLLQNAFAKAQQDYLDSAAAGPRDLGGRNWSETERQVAQCIADALDAPNDMITRWQPLAAVGLDSITAVSVAKALSSQFKHRLPISSVLKNQSVAKLSQLILASPAQDPVDSPPALNEVFLEADFLRRTTATFASDGKDVETILPSTPLQDAMLSSTDSDSYLNRLVFRLKIPQGAAKEHWQRLAHRHGILRTCFVTTTDRRHSTAQVVLRSWPLPWIDDQGGQSTYCDTHSWQMVPKALDSRTPPYVLEIFNRNDATFLSFSCHHALFDGESMNVLLREMELLHQQQILPPTLSYERILQSIFALPESTDTFWRRTFEGFHPRRRGLSRARKEKVAAEAQILPRAVSSTLRLSLSSIKTAASEAGVSLLAFCQAAWLVVLTKVFDEPDVCFGNVMSGRTLPIDGIDTLAAPCFNTVPIRLDLSEDAGVAKLLRRLQKLNSELLDYQFTPLRLIQKLVAPASGRLFDNILLLQPPRKQLNPEIWEMVEDTGAMDVPLACELIPDSEMDTIETNLYSNSSDLDAHKLSAINASIAWAFDVLVKIPASRLLSGLQMPQELRQSLSKNGLNSLPRLPAVDIASASSEELRSGSLNECWTVHEEIIRESLAKLSGVSENRIHRQTTIFELGLDSISAVQIAALLREHGLGASAVDVVQSPSCADLARELTRSVESEPQRLQQQQYDIRRFEREVGSNFKQRPVSPDSFDRLLPCTPVQCGMLSDFLQSQGQHYVNFLSFKFNPDINSKDVELAWQALFQHYSMLRTGFVQVDHPDSAFAMVQYSADIPCPCTTSDHGSDFDFQRWQSNSSTAIFQNFQNLTWRVAIDESISGVTMHLAMLHALYDAESMHRMMQGLADILKGQILPPEEPIDLAISSILGAALDRDASSLFWQQKAPQAVINSFPIVTPLIDTSASLQVESRTMQMRFSDFRNDARKIGVSIQSLLQAAWAKILAAYLGEQRVVFGVVLSGRTTTETKRALCPTFVTLPIIADSRVSNDELLRHMMEYNAELLEHQYCPLPWIQKWLGYPATQIFDTLLVYQRLSSALSSDELPWHKVHDEAKLQYPLSLEFEPLLGDVVEMRISYRANVIPKKQASLMLLQFEATLSELSYPGEPQKPAVGDDLLSISPPLEPEIFADEELLHQFVETTSRNSPDKVAVEFVTAFHGEVSECQTWSFYELNQMGDRVANILTQRAPGPGLVAVHFDKCPEAFFSMLGILKAGFGFLALDCSAPPSRKEFILEDSGAIALLTESATLDFQVSQPVIQITMPLLAEVSPKPLQIPHIRKSDTCYCLYTSGTTGTPKGCEISHENAVQAMKAFQRLFDGHWDDSSRWLQFASLHFDVSVLEQYWTWSVGMTMVAAPRELILDDLAATIRRLRITHIDLTPSLARLLDPEDVPSLCKGVFITGGEALKQEILETWGPSGVIYNAYGPTEATIGVTMYQRVPVNGRPSNIGRQFDNVGTIVLQPGTETPVMRGAVGELCIFGKLVGKGYLNRHQLTQERFPTLKGLGTRVYRTGDLVRQLHDGCFDFLGRIDDQVKLRGQRLEIGEINHAILSTAPNIKDVATLVAQHPTAGKDLLVSFVVPELPAQTSSDPDTLAISATRQLRIAAQSACRKKLPGYMVPTYVFEVPFMPLSVNNKADGKTLGRLFSNLAPEELLQASSSDQSQPMSVTPTQRSIMMAVKEFGNFPQDTISVSTNLFDLGIDSISSLRLSRILKRAGHSVADPAMILRNPVLSNLAEAIGKAERSHDLGNTQEAQQVVQAFDHRFRFQVLREVHLDPSADIEYVAPCTPLQQGMLSNALAREGKAYFAAFRLNLVAETSVPRLKEAWLQLVAQHSIFRTTFCRTTEGFAQIALKSAHLPWRETNVNEDDFDNTLKAARDSWMAENRDIMKRPLEILLVTSPSRTVAVVHIFHAIYDGTSLDFMLQWVAEEYLGGEHPETTSFIEAMCLGPMRNFDFTRPFWTEHLKNCDFSLIGGPSNSSTARYHSVCREVSLDGLEDTRKRAGVTLQTLVLALWSVVFGSCVSTKAAFGVVVSGRVLDIDRSECILGPLFNTLPFHADLKSEAWQSTLSRCHHFNTASLEHQHVSLRKIQQWCSGGRPIFDSLFVFQSDTPPPSETDRLWHLQDDASFLDYPLAFEASATPEHRLRVRLVASADVFTESKLLKTLDEFETMAARVSQGEETGLEQKFSGPITDFHGINGTKPKPELWSNEQIPLETPVPDFDWSETALTIQQAISSLASVPLDHISSEVSLLELGLDSIDAVSLSTRLRDGGISLSMPQILRAKSIRGMCFAIAQTQSRSNPGDEATTVGQASFHSLISRLEQHVKATGLDMSVVESILPATPTQASMMADMIDSDFTHYFNHDILELSSDTDLSRLAESWATLLERSPILRTVFHQVEDPRIDHTFVQVVLKTLGPLEPPSRLEIMDDLKAIIRRNHREAASKKGYAHLCRVSFAQVQDKSFLVLSLAHSLYDGWSLSLLFQDLASLYNGHGVERPSYDLAVRDAVNSTRDHAAQRFWSQYLADASPSVVQERARKGGQFTHRIERASSKSIDRVTEFCRMNSISLQVLGSACWSVVLAAWLGTLDVTFGIVLSGRDTAESQQLAFPMVNTVAARSILHGSSKSFLGYMQGTIIEVHQYRAFPLRKAMSVAKAPKPLFNTLFLLQRHPDSNRPRDSRATLLESKYVSAATEFAVCVELEDNGECLTWRLAGEDAFVSAQMVVELCDQLERVLQHFLHDVEAKMLHFEEDHVSICGLEPFSITEQRSRPRQVSVEPLASSDESINWSETALLIRGALAGVAGIPESSVLQHHTPYHLGLDSVSVIKVSFLLRKRGLEVSPRTLLAASSITEMADLVEQNQPGSGSLKSLEEQEKNLSKLVDIHETLHAARVQPGHVQDTLPALPMQEYMMTSWQNSAGRLFWPTFKYRLASHVSFASLESSWRALVASEPILRTCLIATTKRPMPFMQVVLRPNVGGPHEAVMLQTSDVEQLEDQDESNCPWPQVRVTASKHHDCTWILQIKIHHALYDGVSLPRLISRLEMALRGAVLDHPEQYLHHWKRFVHFHHDKQATSSRQAFWTEYLKHSSDTRLSLDDEAQVQRTAYFERAAIADVRKLRATSTGHGVGIPAIFLASMAQVVRQKVKFEQDDIFLGVYCAQAGQVKELGETFPKLNILPLRVRMTQDADLVEVALQIQKDLHSITSPINSLASLSEIRDWTGISIEICVNFLNDEVGRYENGNSPGGRYIEAMNDYTVEINGERAGSPGTHAPWLQPNTVRDIAHNALDIEASIENESLNIGLFGSAHVVTEDDAKEFVSHLAESMGMA